MPVVNVSGHSVLCSPEDEDLLLESGWRIVESGGKRVVRFLRSSGKYQGIEIFSRLVMGNPAGMVVDHVDGDTLNNRRSNLRACTPQQNACNRKVHRNNTSGVAGVHFDKNNRINPWKAEIRRCNQKIYLGHYETLSKAKEARRVAENIYHGIYARRLA